MALPYCQAAALCGEDVLVTTSLCSAQAASMEHCNRGSVGQTMQRST